MPDKVPGLESKQFKCTTGYLVASVWYDQGANHVTPGIEIRYWDEEVSDLFLDEYALPIPPREWAKHAPAIIEFLNTALNPER